MDAVTSSLFSMDNHLLFCAKEHYSHSSVASLGNVKSNSFIANEHSNLFVLKKC